MSLHTPPEERWMSLALQEAEAALEESETPVGAVILEAQSGRVLARAHHQVEALNDPTAHAVMIALTQLASGEQSSEYADSSEEQDLAPAPLSDTGPARELLLVTTQEPCVMCLGAILLRPEIKRLLIGAPEPRLGACGSAVDLARLLPGSSSLVIGRGILEARCVELLRRQRTFEQSRSTRATRKKGRS